MNSPRNIVIATGIYPPDIGGPAEYARQLYETLITERYEVSVVTYDELKRFPTGLRHFFYFIKLCIFAFDADYVIALDTFSVGLPAVFFSKLFFKKSVVRVGGDFLWESYVERTRTPILLSEFYTKARTYSIKERIIFAITRLVFTRASAVVFTTEWQRKITCSAYDILELHTRIVENMYPAPEPIETNIQSKKVFLSPSRDRFVKNKSSLMVAFDRVARENPDIVLDMNVVSHEVLLEKIQKAYAVIIPSLSEVSPNMVCDALRYGVPCIVTKDTGIFEKIQGMSIFVDPLSVDSIQSGIERLLTPSTYEEYKKNIHTFTETHSWNEIGQEFIDIYGTL